MNGNTYFARQYNNQRDCFTKHYGKTNNKEMQLGDKQNVICSLRFPENVKLQIPLYFYQAKSNTLAFKKKQSNRSFIVLNTNKNKLIAGNIFQLDTQTISRYFIRNPSSTYL